MGTPSFNRRSFIRQIARFVGGALAFPLFVKVMAAGDDVNDEKRKESGLKGDSQRKAGFPIFEVSGTNYEIGFKIGERFGENIREGFRRRNKWFENLKSIADGDFAREFKGYIRAAKKHFPQYVDEVRGWAEGAGVPFEDMMILNMWAELTAMKRSRGEGSCSTISLNDGKRIILAHNEDGSAAYRGLMFWLKATPRDGRSFQTLSYPGLLPGNSPGFNDAGIVQTTNYTPAAEWRIGIPRYFLNRAIFDAGTLDEAVKVATHARRGYGNHHNLASLREQRIISLEVTPDKHQVHEVKGVYFHTNHLILDAMKDQPQFPGRSSLTRYRVLTKETESWKDARKVKVSDIVKALSNHERKPNSVCRHAVRYTGGATLGTAVFEIHKGTFRLYSGNPCEGNFSVGRL